MTDNNSSGPDIFARKTFKEVKIWDWLARLLPLSVLAVLAVLHFFKWSDYIGLILEITLIVFIITCFVWWYWALYKIAASVKYLQSAQDKFDEIRKEFKEMKKSFVDRNDKDK